MSIKTFISLPGALTDIRHQWDFSNRSIFRLMPADLEGLKKPSSAEAFGMITPTQTFGQTHLHLRANQNVDLLNMVSLTNVTSVRRSGPKVIKLFLCSTQLSMKIFLLINVKMPTTFISGEKYHSWLI